MAPSLNDDSTRRQRPAFNPNQEALTFIRIIGNIAGGCTAGLLGLTGKDGAAFYLALSVMISSTLLLKTAFQPFKFLTSPTTTILFTGLFDRNAILTYILFWTMLFSFR